MSNSHELRNDTRALSANHNTRELLTCAGIDTYIRFLTATNALADHKQKPFKKIDGPHFKM